MQYFQNPQPGLSLFTILIGVSSSILWGERLFSPPLCCVIGSGTCQSLGICLWSFSRKGRAGREVQGGLEGMKGGRPPVSSKRVSTNLAFPFTDFHHTGLFPPARNMFPPGATLRFILLPYLRFLKSGCLMELVISHQYFTV